jgi:hypothetical protein
MAVALANCDRRIKLLHDLAEKVRSLAEPMHDFKLQRTMYLTAASYERMAKKLGYITGHLSLPESPSPRLSP